MHEHCLSVTLTYDDETQHNRDGAAMFRYSDIDKFLKRVRRQIKYYYKRDGALRYVIAGEQGDRNARCHWHIILFSDVDLITLGTISAFGNEINDRSNIVTTWPQKALRRNWSLWGHGFVTFQEANEGAIHYALSYALKNQFTTVNSARSKRIVKAETFAVGFFRMSKFPPIGQTYLHQYLQKLSDQRQTLPKAVVTVPDMKGYWRPVGALRKYFLTGLADINERVLAERGRPTVQWSSLVASVGENQKDREALRVEEIEIETVEDLNRSILNRAGFDEDEKRRRQIARRCGSTLPCTHCINSLDSAEECRRIGVVAIEVTGAWRYQVAPNCHGVGPEGDQDGKHLWRLQNDRRAGGVNQDCWYKDTKRVKATFIASSKKSHSG